jgi:hypothetical protein
VVNQEIAGLTTEDPNKKSKKHAALDATNSAPVTLYDGGKNPPHPVPYGSIVPKAIKEAFHDWMSEVMNQGVHVHSKVIVIDPFGEKPVVMTGSHNLGHKASTQNDDNLMIIEGNAPLAAAYAINIIAIYQTYRWNTYVDQHDKDPQVWHGPIDDPKWQDSYLADDSPDLAEIKFWLGQGVSAPAAAGQPVPAPSPGSSKVRAATATGPAAGAAPAGKASKRQPKRHTTPHTGRPTKHTPKAPAKRAAAAHKRPARKQKAPRKRAPAKRRRAA